MHCTCCVEITLAQMIMSSPKIRPSRWTHSKTLKWSQYLGVNILTIQLTYKAMDRITNVTVTSTTGWTCWMVNPVLGISIGVCPF